jgi:hypothetical protein
MRKRVIEYKVQGLDILINIVDKLHSHKEVKTIQEKLSKMLEDPKQYRCCPKDEIDNIFKGPSGDWADEKDGGGYGAIKPTFKIIKELMFKDDSECPEFDGPEKF